MMVNPLVKRGELSNSDRHPVNITEFSINADSLPPRSTAKQHHLADTGGNSNSHSTRTFSTEIVKSDRENKRMPSLVSRFRQMEATEMELHQQCCTITAAKRENKARIASLSLSHITNKKVSFSRKHVVPC